MPPQPPDGAPDAPEDPHALIQALRASEARYRALVEGQADFVVRWKPDGTRTYVNAAYCRYFGGTPEQHVGTSFFPLIAEEDRARILAKIAGLTPGHPVATAEQRVIRADGSIGWNEWTDRAIFDEHGQVVEMVSVGRDTTERHEAEVRLRTLAEAAFEGIAVTRAGRCIDANTQLAAMLGVPIEKLVDTDVMTWVAPDDRARVAAHIASGDDAPYEHLARRADGTEFPVEVRGKTLPGADGLRITAIRDITERHRIDAALRASEAQLRQAQKMEAVGQLTAGIAHDFNNILMVILANLELLAKPDAPAAPEVRAISDAVQLGRTIVGQLMGFSRRADLHPMPVAVGATVDRLAPMLRRLVPQTIRVDVRVEEPLPTALADESAVEQMLLNLILNARDAMPQGGVITVTVETDRRDDVGTRLAVSVRDTGTGMDDGTRRRVFEPFFTTKAAGVGSGLGLPMVSGLMEQLGGVVELESAPGAGTIVRLLFPVSSSP